MHVEKYLLTKSQKGAIPSPYSLYRCVRPFPPIQYYHPSTVKDTEKQCCNNNLDWCIGMVLLRKIIRHLALPRPRLMNFRLHIPLKLRIPINYQVSVQFLAEVRANLHDAHKDEE